MANVIELSTGKIQPGQTVKVFSAQALASGTQVIEFVVESDSVLGSLYVTSVTGSVDVEFYTYTEEDKESLVFSFPTISAPTANLLLEKAAVTLTNIRVKCTWTGAATFEVRARGLSVGETTTKIVGPSTASASKITVGTSAQVVIAASFTDRQAMVIKNNNTSGILYIGFTLAEATTANGYPLAPGEQMGIDLESGAVVYGIGTVSIDLRIMQAGG